MENNKELDDYYDLISNRIIVRGFNYSDAVVSTKFIQYPGVLQNIYTISDRGLIYNVTDDCYISWSYKNGLPYVNLGSSVEGHFARESYYIKDLMAYNYIANAKDYLERGLKVVNVDGDPNNCYYRNIMYIDPNKEIV